MRLCKFLSTILPLHQDYFANDMELKVLRVKSQTQLADLLPYLDQLESVIDEEEHQLYISLVLGTEGEDDDDDNVDHETTDQSNVNTTISSYDFPPNPQNASLDMAIILDNSLVDSYEQEAVELPPRAPRRRSPVRQSASSSHSKIRSQSPVARQQEEAASDWDSAWQQTTLHHTLPSKRSIKVSPAKQKSDTWDSAWQHQQHAPDEVDDDDWDDSAWKEQASLSARVQGVSSDRDFDTLESLESWRQISRIAEVSVETSTESPPESQLPKTAVDLDDAAVDDDDDTEPCRDSWNFPYSATAPDWMSTGSDGDDMSSKWTMNLSMASSQFVAPPPGQSTPRASPMPARISAKSSRSAKRLQSNPAVKLFQGSVYQDPEVSRYQSSPLKQETAVKRENAFVDEIATAFVDQDTDLLLESKIEKRWEHSRKQQQQLNSRRATPRKKGATHSFTTLRDGSPKSIIDMDNWRDDSREETSRLHSGKEPLLVEPKVEPPTPARKQDSFRRLDEAEDEDDTASVVEARALTRRGRALQPFKSCVRCLLD